MKKNLEQIHSGFFGMAGAAPPYPLQRASRRVSGGGAARLRLCRRAGARTGTLLTPRARRLTTGLRLARLRVVLIQ